MDGFAFDVQGDVYLSLGCSNSEVNVFEGDNTTDIEDEEITNDKGKVNRLLQQRQAVI
jgi:hypothetical protein